MLKFFNKINRKLLILLSISGFWQINADQNCNFVSWTPNYKHIKEVILRKQPTVYPYLRSCNDAWFGAESYDNFILDCLGGNPLKKEAFRKRFLQNDPEAEKILDEPLQSKTLKKARIEAAEKSLILESRIISRDQAYIIGLINELCRNNDKEKIECPRCLALNEKKLIDEEVDGKLKKTSLRRLCKKHSKSAHINGGIFKSVDFSGQSDDKNFPTQSQNPSLWSWRDIQDPEKITYVDESVFSDLRVFVGDRENHQTFNNFLKNIKKAITHWGCAFVDYMFAKPSKDLETLNSRRDFIKKLVENDDLYNEIVSILGEMAKCQIKVNNFILANHSFFSPGGLWLYPDGISHLKPLDTLADFSVKMRKFKEGINKNPYTIGAGIPFRIFVNFLSIMMPISIFLASKNNLINNIKEEFGPNPKDIKIGEYSEFDLNNHSIIGAILKSPIFLLNLPVSVIKTLINTYKSGSFQYQNDMYGIGPLDSLLRLPAKLGNFLVVDPANFMNNKLLNKKNCLSNLARGSLRFCEIEGDEFGRSNGLDSSNMWGKTIHPWLLALSSINGLVTMIPLVRYAAGPLRVYVEGTDVYRQGQFFRSMKKNTPKQYSEIQAMTLALANFVKLSKRLSKLMRENFPSGHPLTLVDDLHEFHSDLNPQLHSILNELSSCNKSTIRFKILSVLRKAHPFRWLFARLAESIGQIDAMTSFATLVRESRTRATNQFCPVEFIKSCQPGFKIDGFWNPFFNPETAVPNSLSVGLDLKEQHMILTGLNGGGKSTALRNIVFCILMGQVCGFAPAQNMVSAIYDNIYTCMSTKDFAEGKSTYMVQNDKIMEVLKLIEQSNERQELSLFALDEIYGGTDNVNAVPNGITFGLFCCKNRANTVLFSSHFHQMCSLEERTAGLFKNIKIKAEKDEQGKFKRIFKIEPGRIEPGHDAIGLQLTKDSGAPKEFVDAAERIKMELFPQR